jgi:ADP-heptose:LPS heptosyltransferase
MIKKFNVEKIKQLDKVNKILSVFYRKPKCKNSKSLDEIENILIVDFALIGDMVMNIPFIKAIRANCPNTNVTMVCMPWAEVVLGDQNLIDDFVIFNGKDLLSSPKSIAKNYKIIKSTIKRINQKYYDIGFEPKGDLRHTLFLRYTNSDRTVTYDYTGGDYLVTDSFQPLQDTKHLIDEKFDLLKMSGFETEGFSLYPRLELTEEWKKYVNQFAIQNKLDGYHLIGVHPGASNVNKQYRYYPDVVSKLKDDNVKFLIFEGSGEKKIVDEVCAVLWDTEYIRVKKKLKEYISLVSLCDYMLCNDSAAGHIAAAYGIPATIIFGPVSPEVALPRGTGRINYVSHELKCKPCTLPVCSLGTETCIREITVDEVMNAIEHNMKDEL